MTKRQRPDPAEPSHTDASEVDPSDRDGGALSRPQKLLIVGGVASIVAIAIGGVGFYYGHAWSQPELVAASERAESLRGERRGLRAELSLAADQLAATQRRVTLLEARQQIAIAIDQLDARNFGLAQQHCERSAALLRGLEASPTISNAAARLERIQFDAGANPDEAREQLRVLATTLDEQLVVEAEPAEEGEEAHLGLGGPRAG